MTIQERIDIDRTFGTLGGNVSNIVITDLQGTKFCESLRMLESYNDFILYQRYQGTDRFQFVDSSRYSFPRNISVVESVKIYIDNNEYNKFMSIPYTDDVEISQFGYGIMIEIKYYALNKHTRHYINQYIIKRFISFKKWCHSDLAGAVYKVLDTSLNVNDYIMDTSHDRYMEYMELFK